MNRGERRDLTKRKAESRRKRLISAKGVPSKEAREHYMRQRFLDTEPIGKFRNNNIANEYGGAGTSIKTNRRKGHSVYRAKLGAYGKAMNWKPHDQRQIDSEEDDLGSSSSQDFS